MSYSFKAVMEGAPTQLDTHFFGRAMQRINARARLAGRTEPFTDLVSYLTWLVDGEVKQLEKEDAVNSSLDAQISSGLVLATSDVKQAIIALLKQAGLLS